MILLISARTMPTHYLLFSSTQFANLYLQVGVMSEAMLSDLQTASKK